MGYLIIAGILVLIAIGGFITAVIGTRENADPDLKVAGLGTVGIAVVLLLVVTVAASMTIVDARSVSVQTSFGKYDGIVSPGFHMTAPWADFESFSTTLQPTDLNDFDNDKGDAVVVSFSAPKDPTKPDAKVLAGGGNGSISAIVNWKISEDESDSSGTKALWEKYRTFDAVSTQLVKTKAQDTISDVANDLPANEATVNQTIIGQQVKEKLGTLLKPYGIVVQDVSIRRIVLDPATATSLQKIIDAINKTAAATEEAKAAAIQNKILEDRQKAGALEEKANQRYCFDIVNSWRVTENGPLPATFNCGLGTGGSLLLNSK